MAYCHDSDCREPWLTEKENAWSELPALAALRTTTVADRAAKPSSGTCHCRRARTTALPGLSAVDGCDDHFAAAWTGVVDGRWPSGSFGGMTPEEMADLAHLRRACDLIDRDYAQPLNVPAMARTALMSPAHFSRKFRAAYGETPYSYLMTRRIERAKALLRQGKSVTDTCVAVGCTSLGSFSSRFTEIVGVTPSQYRERDHRDLEVVPSCVSMLATRPRRTTVTV